MKEKSGIVAYLPPEYKALGASNAWGGEDTLGPSSIHPFPPPIVPASDGLCWPSCNNDDDDDGAISPPPCCSLPSFELVAESSSAIKVPFKLETLLLPNRLVNAGRGGGGCID